MKKNFHAGFGEKCCVFAWSWSALFILSVIFLEKDLRNFELYRKKKLSRQLKPKNSSISKSKYLTY